MSRRYFSGTQGNPLSGFLADLGQLTPGLNEIDVDNATDASDDTAGRSRDITIGARLHSFRNPFVVDSKLGAEFYRGHKVFRVVLTITVDM